MFPELVLYRTGQSSLSPTITSVSAGEEVRGFDLIVVAEDGNIGGTLCWAKDEMIGGVHGVALVSLLGGRGK
jgi:hypothetical protein